MPRRRFAVFMAVMRVLRSIALGAWLLVASHASAEEAPPGPGWTYRVRFAADLSSARIDVTFHGVAPARLILMRADALGALRMQTPFRTNPSRDGVLPRLVDGGIAYTVDFRRLAQITRGDKHTQFVGRDLVTRAGLFLLHPPEWPATARVQATLELPAGMEAAVPWQRDIVRSVETGRTTYVVPSHAMAPHARIAFGRFTPKRVEVAGGDLIYYALDAPRRATEAGIARWLSRAMETVSDLFGKPPVPRTHVIVQPLVPGRGRPVVFGRATLSGGPALHVMLSGTTTDARMPGEWITIHEMIHLGLPVTTLADRWFGEGFVSYYQEVLRARAGILTPQQAWQNLHDWMARGRASGGKRPLGEESRLMSSSYAYHRVYWGGAAVALKMDVAIRRTTSGRMALDDVMRRFHAQHVSPGATVPALELMRHADVYLGARICEPMARRALGSRAFPDLRQTYAGLGLEVSNRRIVLRRDAPHAAIRDAIMRRAGR